MAEEYCGQPVFFKNGVLNFRDTNGNCIPLVFGSSISGSGGLSRNQIINLINQFGGGLAPSYQATATNDITTQSTTDVVATGMTLTPPAGIYLVWFSGSGETNNVGSNGIFTSIYYNNSQIASSEQGIIEGSNSEPFNCVAKITVDGTKQIEGRWRMQLNNSDTATMHQRNLTALKVSI